MNLRYVYKLGTDEIEDDPLLKLNEKGEGPLYSMMEYVVPGLEKLNKNGQNLIQRWRAIREQPNSETKVFAAYICNENNEIISIATGIIIDRHNVEDKEDKHLIRFLNTATLPQYRQQGFLSAVIAETVETVMADAKQKYDEDQINLYQFDASLTTKVNSKYITKDGRAVKPEDVATGEIKEDELLDKDLVKQIILEAHANIANSAGENVIEKLYNAIAAQDTDEAKAINRAFVNSNLWSESTSLKLARKFLEALQELAEMGLEVGKDTGNINIAPRAPYCQELMKLCQDVKQSFYTQQTAQDLVAATTSAAITSVTRLMSEKQLSEEKPNFSKL